MWGSNLDIRISRLRSLPALNGILIAIINSYVHLLLIPLSVIIDPFIVAVNATD